MKKIYLLMAIAIPLLFVSCKKEKPIADFSVSPVNEDGTCIVGVNESVTFKNNSSDADSYEWYFGDGKTSTEESPKHSYSKEGTYWVTLLATNGAGITQAWGTVYVEEVSEGLVIRIYDEDYDSEDYPWGSDAFIEDCSVWIFDNYTDYSTVNTGDAVFYDETDAEGRVVFEGFKANTKYYILAYKQVTGGYLMNVTYTNLTTDASLSQLEVYLFPMTYFQNFTTTFNNTTYTDIDITINDVTKTAPVGGSASFEFTSNPGSYSYTAETYGATTSGTQIGIKITWSYTHYVSSYTSYTTNLQVASDYFFLKMQNNGYAYLGPLRVNVGKLSATYDNISIPNNGVTYNLGYYRAYSDTRVEADYAGSAYEYIYWQSLPFTWSINQSMLLTNSLKKQEVVKSDIPKPVNYVQSLDNLVVSKPDKLNQSPKADRTDISSTN